jgi:hypothetical protein
MALFTLQAEFSLPCVVRRGWLPESCCKRRTWLLFAEKGRSADCGGGLGHGWTGGYRIPMPCHGPSGVGSPAGLTGVEADPGPHLTGVVGHQTSAMAAATHVPADAARILWHRPYSSNPSSRVRAAITSLGNGSLRVSSVRYPNRPSEIASSRNGMFRKLRS